MVVEDATSRDTALEVTPGGARLEVGETVDLAARLTASGGVVEDVSDQVTWTSDDLTVATVADDGELTARGLGEATITATLGSLASQITALVTDEPLRPTSITVSPDQVTLAPSASLQLTADATLDRGQTIDVSRQATWLSEDSAVARVDAMGEVVGVSVGATSVTATFGERTASVAVTVEEPGPKLIELIVTPANTDVCDGTGRTVQLKVNAYYDDPAYPGNGNQPSDLEWSSSDEAVAVVDEDGLVTVKESQAEAVISARVGEVVGSATDSCYLVE